MRTLTQQTINKNFIFHNKLQFLLNSRLHWLTKKSETISSNIASADIKNSKRKEIIPFHVFWSKQNRSIGNQPPKKESITTNEEIAREFEIIEMSNVTTEFDTLVNILKTYQKMIKIVVGKQG